MEKTEIRIGDKVLVADGRQGFVNKNGEEINVPNRTTLYFQNGFAVRQHCDVAGAGMYGHPTFQSWTVMVIEQNGVKGLLLPRINEKLEYIKERRWLGKLFRKKWRIVIMGVLRREQTFIPLSKIRDGIAEVKSMI